MPSMHSLIRLLAVVLSLSLTVGIKADEIQDINQLFRKGDLNTALSRANQFLVKNPKDAQVRFLKGLILADQGKSAEAIQVFTSITEDYPELPEPYNNLAVLYAAEGKYDAAKNALEMAIRTHPSYATAHENLGDLYAKMASQAYDKALQIDGSNKTAQTKLALIKDMISGKPQRPAAAQPASSQPTPTIVIQTASPSQSAAKPTVVVEEKLAKPVVSTLPAVAAVVVEEKPSKPATSKIPDVVTAVQAWAKAWSNKDVDAYLSHYSPEFMPTEMTYAEWLVQRRERVTAPGRVSVIAKDIRINRPSQDRAQVTFKQEYKSDRFNNTSSKTLDMVLAGDKWLIVRESGR